MSAIEAGDRRLDLIEFLDIAHALEFDPGAFVTELHIRTHGPKKR
jgi:hypothetical protein